MTVGELLEKLSEAPVDAEVMIAVTERREKDGLRATSYHEVAFTGYGEDRFELRGYGNRELAQQAIDAQWAAGLKRFRAQEAAMREVEDI